MPCFQPASSWGFGTRLISSPLAVIESYRSCPMAPTVVFLFVVMCVFVEKIYSQKTHFVFPEYDYKETNKNELAYREFESACEQSPTCGQLKALHRVRCIRECISPSCYHHIYFSDQIEEGEIDVRLNSFKGCFIQRTSRTR